MKNSWQPIKDYTISPTELCNEELESLAKFWQEQRSALDPEELKTFLKKLRREWAIETGLIEKLYTFDRGITQLLIEQGVDASIIPHGSGGQDTTNVAKMITSHENVVDGLFSFVKEDRSLSISYIKEMHAQLTRHQKTASAVDSLGHPVTVDLLRGEFKTQPNNPTRPDGTKHVYCPPEHVHSEMDRLIEMHNAHAEIAPEVEAAWLHHRFAQIHPFQDGNGRVARCLSTIIFIKANWFPLVVRNEERDYYLNALENADQGDLAPLVEFFCRVQKNAFLKALSLARDVQTEQLDSVVAAVVESLKNKSQAEHKKWDEAKIIADELNKMTQRCFDDVADSLSSQTQGIHPKLYLDVTGASNTDGNSHYFRHQIIGVANKLNYFANTREFRAWTRLRLSHEEQASILVSFHALGKTFRGVVVASAGFFRRYETDEGEWETSEVIPLSNELFQINYLENPDNVKKRFECWINEVLTLGLATWERET